ncbi:MAG: hypothetical protein LBO72_01070 [Helicobacteraceae bacterium]|nr:hypothetical protein [Helicobacteraceae bacterium]
MKNNLFSRAWSRFLLESPIERTKTVVIFLAAAIFCWFMPRAIDQGHSLERVICAIVLVLLARSTLLSAISVFTIALLPTVYAIFGLEFGALYNPFVAAFFETNPQEAKEFMGLIPIKNYFISFGLAALAAFALFAWRRKPTSLSLSLSLSQDCVRRFANRPFLREFVL